jgi:hypothetical protein
MSDGEFALTVCQAKRGLAVKKRTRYADGQTAKCDLTLNESLWRFVRFSIDGDADRIAGLLRVLTKRQDLCTIHGAPAPGVEPHQWRRRWSAESRGVDRTIVSADRSYIVIDLDDAPAPKGLDAGQSLYELAIYTRETLLPSALRHVDLVIGVASSTGLKPDRGSLHAYARLDRPIPLSVQYKWLAGAKASGLPLDPRPALPGQPFLTGRPIFEGLDDPVPESLHAFVLPGRWRSVGSIDWDEFKRPLAAYEKSERHARAIGTSEGWRAILEDHLGDGPGRLGFFNTLSIALGCAARSGEPVDDVVGAMTAIVATHPDFNADRAGRYTADWLRRELMRFRAKDAERRRQADQTLLDHARRLLVRHSAPPSKPSFSF